MRRIILDLETTGFSPQIGERIIEIAGIELQDKKITGNYLHIYINPNRKSHKRALRTHGISIDFLKHRPVFEDVLPEILSFIKGAELIIHNAKFDVSFLDKEFQEADKSIGKVSNHCRVIDSLNLARKKLKHLKAHSLTSLSKHYKISDSHRLFHGALVDAALLAKIYMALIDKKLTFDFLSPDHTLMSYFDESSLLYKKNKYTVLFDYFQLDKSQQRPLLHYYHNRIVSESQLKPIKQFKDSDLLGLTTYHLLAMFPIEPHAYIAIAKYRNGKAAKGHRKAIEPILPNTPAADNVFPLHLLMYFSNGLSPLIETLTALGTLDDTVPLSNWPINLRDRYGKLPIEMAIETLFKPVDTVKALLKLGTDINLFGDNCYEKYITMVCTAKCSTSQKIKLIEILKTHLEKINHSVDYTPPQTIAIIKRANISEGGELCQAYLSTIEEIPKNTPKISDSSSLIFSSKQKKSNDTDDFTDDELLYLLSQDSENTISSQTTKEVSDYSDGELLYLLTSSRKKRSRSNSPNQ